MMKNGLLLHFDSDELLTDNFSNRFSNWKKLSMPLWTLCGTNTAIFLLLINWNWQFSKLQICGEQNWYYLVLIYPWSSSDKEKTLACQITSSFLKGNLFNLILIKHHSFLLNGEVFWQASDSSLSKGMFQKRKFVKLHIKLLKKFQIKFCSIGPKNVINWNMVNLSVHRGRKM